MARINSDPKTSAPARTGGPAQTPELEGPPAPTLDEFAGDNTGTNDRAASFGGGPKTPLAEGLFDAGPLRTTVTFSPAEVASINTNLDAAYGFELAKHAKVISGRTDINALPPETAMEIIDRLEQAEVAYVTGAVDEGNALLIEASELAEKNGVSLTVNLAEAAHDGTKAEMKTLLQSLIEKGGKLKDTIEGWADATTRVPAKYGQKVMAYVISKQVDIDKLPTNGFYEVSLSAEVSVNTLTAAMENKIGVAAKEINGERVYVVSQEIKAGEGVAVDFGSGEGKALASLMGKREWVAKSETEALEIMSAMSGTLAEGRLAASGNLSIALAHHLLYPRLPKPSAFEAGAELAMSLEAKLGKRLGFEFSNKVEGRARLEQNPDGKVTKVAFTASREMATKLSANLLAGTEGKLSLSAEAIKKDSVVFTLEFSPPSAYEDLLDRLDSAPVSLEAVSEHQASGPVSSKLGYTGIFHSEQRTKIGKGQINEALSNPNFFNGPAQVQLWEHKNDGIGLDLKRGGSGAAFGFEFKKAIPMATD